MTNQHMHYVLLHILLVTQINLLSFSAARPMYVGDGSLGIGFIVIFMHLDKRSIQLVNHIFQNIACQNINKAFKFVSNVQWTSSLTVWSLIKNEC